METTLKEVFEKYPLNIADVAYTHNYSPEWLRSLINGRTHLRPEKQRAHLDMLQAYLNHIGRELAQVQLKIVPINVPKYRATKITGGKRGNNPKTINK